MRSVEAPIQVPNRTVDDLVAPVRQPYALPDVNIPSKEEFMGIDLNNRLDALKPVRNPENEARDTSTVMEEKTGPYGMELSGEVVLQAGDIYIATPDGRLSGVHSETMLQTTEKPVVPQTRKAY